MYIDIADHKIVTFGTGRDENFLCSPIPSGTTCQRTQFLTFNSFRMRLATVQQLGTLHHFLHAVFLLIFLETCFIKGNFPPLNEW